MNVYQASGKGCVTNLEGDFTISAGAEDSLRFSFVGYKTCRWKAGEMPGVVRMQPSALSIAGVTVLSDEAILTRAYKTLKGDLKAHVREKRLYLNRITIRSGGCEEMVEDFLTARSAVNVRSMSVLSGQYWTRTVTGEQVMSQLQYTNLHNLMTAGPLMRQVPLEDYLIQPFPPTFSSSFLNYYYALSSQTLQTDGGGLMYVVEMRPKVDTGKDILYGNCILYIQKAMNFNKVVPQEKVYLHFDNMGYFENETLWFKAYVTRTDNGHLSDLSKVLYVELLNPSGDIVKTCKYPVDSLGVSHGDIKLDSLLTSGYYEVRAYTRYMTNWGTNAVFSRVFPVFKKPAKEGDYSDLTIRTMLYYARDPNNRTSDDSLYQKAIDDGIYTSDLLKTISVKFYPEGGDLVAGKKCRVAMLAVDDNGHPHEGEGFVMNERGDVLASVKTDTLGRGLFEIVPDTGKLTFQMRNLRKSERRGVQYFPLPEAKRGGLRAQRGCRE